jgi:quinoprotein glucose dehydrogenase
MRKVAGLLVLTGVFVAATLASLTSQTAPAARTASTGKPYTNWQSYSGGAHSSQYSALDRINKGNVGKLEVAWTYPVTGTNIFNPAVIDGVMYVPAGSGVLAALDAATGKELWRKEGAAPSGARGMN